MSDPVLFVYPGRSDLPSPSPPCAKVLLALTYSGLPHAVTFVKGDPKGVSPTGRLPALKVGDQTICDSVEILDWLERADPPRRLWPEDPRERARDVVWERFANEHLYWRAVYLRWLVPENQKRTTACLLAGVPALMRPLVSIVAVREVRRRARGQGIGNFPLARVRADLVKALETYEAGLGAGPFLEERSEPGRADFAAGAHLPQLTYEGLTPWAGEQLRQRPRLVEYLARIYAACELPVPAGVSSPSQRSSGNHSGE